jgi:hypothetical protein
MQVHLENVSGSFKLTQIELDIEAQALGLDERVVREQAETAKKALAHFDRPCRGKASAI